MSNFDKIMIDVEKPAPGLEGAACGAREAGGGLRDVYHDLGEVEHPKREVQKSHTNSDYEFKTELCIIFVGIEALK